MGGSVISTVAAECRDCYRCVRACPVKAIRVSMGQARVADELCIHCGTCVKECPQKAKVICNDLGAVKELIASGRPVAASIAPAFAAVYGNACGNLPGVLRRLGFRYVSETAEGAKYVTDKSFAPNQAGNVCTTCPAVTEYVEKYKPNGIKYLIPVVSPMAAHGRLLKSRYENCAVVFIGPCAAKKAEAARPENEGAVDAVITFAELDEWLAAEGIDTTHSVSGGFDNMLDTGDARLFPLEGGMLKTGGLEGGMLDNSSLKLSGAEAVTGLFEEKNLLHSADFIEPMFCEGGCICGPGTPPKKDLSVFERRANILRYHKRAAAEAFETAPETEHAAVFADKSASMLQNEVTEGEVLRILAETGKQDTAWQLNCEACGYKSCVENAKAIARGMAEKEMCIPFMRRLARQRTDLIIDTTPNGVVVLDEELNMIKMNPAFRKMFSCNNGILGRRISYLLNASGFDEMYSGQIETYESIRTQYGIKYHEILYALRDEGQYIGIYSDVSKINFDSRQLDAIKMQTLTHAREFLDHQIKFSQEMAHYLGKSTAESEGIAKKLIALYEGIGI